MLSPSSKRPVSPSRRLLDCIDSPLRRDHSSTSLLAGRKSPKKPEAQKVTQLEEIKCKGENKNPQVSTAKILLEVSPISTPISSPYGSPKTPKTPVSTKESREVDHAKDYFVRQYMKYKQQRQEAQRGSLAMTYQHFLHWMERRGVRSAGCHLTRREFQSFFAWFERRISSFQRMEGMNKERLIDDILEMNAFSNRVHAAQFVHAVETDSHGSVSADSFSAALGNIVDEKEIRLMKDFAHSLIRKEKINEKKMLQHNQLAAVARRRKLLESNSNHVALKQTKHDSQFSIVRAQMKGGGVMYSCSGPVEKDRNIIKESVPHPEFIQRTKSFPTMKSFSSANADVNQKRN